MPPLLRAMRGRGRGGRATGASLHCGWYRPHHHADHGIGEGVLKTLNRGRDAPVVRQRRVNFSGDLPAADGIILGGDDGW